MTDWRNVDWSKAFGQDADDEPEEREPGAVEQYGLLRCPLCGMNRAAKWFDEEMVVQQRLERVVRTSLGGRRGFDWEFGHPYSIEDNEGMQACAIAVLRRLREQAREIGAEVIPFEDDDDGVQEGAVR